MAAVITVNYKTQPRGQVGQKPRKVSRGAELQFDCDDPNCEFQVEIESPIKDRPVIVKRKEQVFAGNIPGVYNFICKCNGITLGDPGQEEGGQLEIGP